MEDVRALEKQALGAAQAEMGRVAPGTIALVILVVVSLGGLAAAGIAGLLPAWLAIGGLVVVHYAAYTPLHEAVHRNVSGGRPGHGWLDDAAGVVCGTVLGTSFTLHRAEHFAHHRRTNVTGEDPNKVFGRGVFGVLRGTLAIVPAAVRWYLQEAWPTATAGSRRRVLAEVALVVLTRAVPMLAGYAEAVLLFWIVPNLLGNMLTAVLFAWIVHEPHDDTARWGNTAAFDFRGALKWPVTVLWLWQNYHAIHHLFPRVPFYRYHAVFHRIDGIMEALGAPVHRFGSEPTPASTGLSLPSSASA